MHQVIWRFFFFEFWQFESGKLVKCQKECSRQAITSKNYKEKTRQNYVTYIHTLSIWRFFFGYWNHLKILILQIDYVDGASSGPPRLRSRGHHPPPLPPSKSTKPCIHKQHRTHPAPVAYNSDLGSTSEVTLATNHKHYSHKVTHHHHHHSSHNHPSHPMPTVYMPGGHVDMHYHVPAQPQQPVKPPSSRGSHSSDTSSAYSGSDTMQVRIEFLHKN